jgi:hypothetical protein
MTTRAPIAAERLAAAARAQTAIPDGTVSDPRPAWEDRLPGIWGVMVDGRGRQANAFLRVAGDRVAVPAGPAQAARELRELGALDGRPWSGGLMDVVVAAGGATPGFPDVSRTGETPLPDGGMRVTLRAPERWIAYAAAGGVGPVPSGATASFDAGGDAAPAPMATATLDISAGYELAWRYQLRDAEIDGPSGAPAQSPPELSDEQLVAALDGARARARAPRAMPAREPRPLDGHPDVLEVDLWALGAVYVGEARIDWTASPPTLLALLSAADALPPGLVPADLLRTATVSDGELTAEVPAPLAEWAADGARQLSPRVPGNPGHAEMGRPGRVRLRLDGSLDWRLE